MPTLVVVGVVLFALALALARHHRPTATYRSFEGATHKVNDDDTREINAG
jgi:hypothetical protein